MLRRPDPIWNLKCDLFGSISTFLKYSQHGPRQRAASVAETVALLGNGLLPSAGFHVRQLRLPPPSPRRYLCRDRVTH